MEISSEDIVFTRPIIEIGKKESVEEKLNQIKKFSSIYSSNKIYVLSYGDEVVIFSNNRLRLELTSMFKNICKKKEDSVNSVLDNESLNDFIPVDKEKLLLMLDFITHPYKFNSIHIVINSNMHHTILPLSYINVNIDIDNNSTIIA